MSTENECHRSRRYDALMLRFPAPKALTHPAVWMGFLGSLALFVAYVGQTGISLVWPLTSMQARWSTALTPTGAALMSTIGVILLSGGWWLARPRLSLRPRQVDLRLAAAVWILPLIIAPPILSQDAVAYCDLGWMIDQGENPYDVGLGTSGGPCSAVVDPFWQGTTSPYPPLGLAIVWLSARIAGFDPFLTTITLRIFTVLAWAGAAVLVSKLAATFGVPRSSALWFGILNPIAIVHLIGGAHGDAFMVAAVLLGLRLATSSRLAISILGASAMGGIAAAFKQQAAIAWWALALVPLGGLPSRGQGWREWKRALWRMAATVVIAAATFSAVTLMSGLGFGWINSLSLSTRSASLAPARILSLVLAQYGDDRWSAITATSQLVAILSALACLLAFPRDPVKGLAWGSLCLFVLGAVLHPWYLVFPLAILAISRISSLQAWLVSLLMVWLGTGMVFYETLPSDPFATGLHVVLVAAIVGVVLTVAFALVFRLTPRQAPSFIKQLD